MHKGQVFSTSNYRLQPFTVDLEENYEMILEGLHKIFSKQQVIEFNVDRKLKTIEDAHLFLHSTFLGYEEKTFFNYFLIDKVNNALAGTITLISPKTTSSIYPFFNHFINSNKEKDSTWTIEFYLDPMYWNKGIMTNFVSVIVKELFKQGATNVCALTNTQNIASISLLKKLSFIQIDEYNDFQGQVLWNRKLQISLV